MDPKSRFSDTTADYRLHRPDYPAALLDWLRGEAPGRRAVDLAAGTGIFTRQLAAAGFDVVGVEPNAEMRAAAESEPGAPPMRAGAGEATGLPDSSADLVTVAQAFHWFELDAALREIDRVTAPGGFAVAVWNLRAATPFNDAYDALLTAFSPDYRAVIKGEATIARLRGARPAGTALCWPHGQRLDAQGLHGRAWSSSYVRHGVRDVAAFDCALADLFAAHAEDGHVWLAYDTVGWAWRRAAGA